MTIHSIKPLPLSREAALDGIFKDKKGIIQPIDTEYLSKFTQEEISAYCVKNAMYGIITHQLISIVDALIGDRIAIEIGSGNGTFGRALNIPMFDNYLQERPDVKLAYSLAMQPVIKYGADVKRVEALEAIKTTRPQVVVGSWITGKHNQRLGDHRGIDEDAMFNYGVEMYIMFGNGVTHDEKPLFNNPNFKVSQMTNPFFFSRSLYKSYNKLYIVEKL